MLTDYKDFILRTNTLALAIGVIAGAAIGNLVTSIVNDLVMPVVSFILPTGEWNSAQFILSRTAHSDGSITFNAIKYGHFIGTIINFLVISFVVYTLVKFLRVKGLTPVSTKQCQECLEDIPLAAKKCRACGSELTALPEKG